MTETLQFGDILGVIHGNCRGLVHGWEERRVGVTYHALTVPNYSNQFSRALFGEEFGCGGHAFSSVFGSEITTAEVESIDGVWDVEEFLEFADGVGGGEGRSKGAGGRTVELEVDGGVPGDGREEAA